MMRSLPSGPQRVLGSPRDGAAYRRAAPRPQPRRRCAARAAAAPPPPQQPPQPRPPAPQQAPGLPFLGSFSFFNLPQRYALWAQLMRERGIDAMQIELLGRKAYVIRSPESVGRIIRQTDKFPKSKTEGLSRLEEWLGDGLVTQASPELHAAMRDVLAPAFKAASIKGFVPAFAKSGEEVADFLASLGGREYDIEPLCRRVTLDVIGRTMFGFDFGAVALEAAAAAGTTEGGSGNSSSSGSGSSSSGNGGSSTSSNSSSSGGGGKVDVVGALDGIFGAAVVLMAAGALPTALVPGIQAYRRGISTIDGVIDSMLRERREKGLKEEDTDLLSFMLRAQQQGNALVTDKQLRDELQTMVLAGSDTTAGTLAFALHELAARPQLLARCQAEADAALGDGPAGALPAEAFQRLALISGAANETLRLHSAVPMLTRVCLEESVLGGCTVPAGAYVFASFHALHRHEAHWPRADEWLPERWLPQNAAELAPHADVAFLPFSSGPRACIGRFFAGLELSVLLAVLLRRLDFFPAGGGGGAPLRTRQKFTLASADGVRVVARPRARGGGAPAAR
ncbi:cytochrome P450 [Raphidocelis subcapitata]|uniref:Cytochrome P450 n=1 Tax=Raphidocelis subcapitata TaxID=307507 RepID=A0A2V0NLR6_9CHLO|nr:cytochrome P450 [Raphidocelis subcapitata]|eukprot:GBF87312.1 cytochrome P450 [Raphidocelis subcapitata]